MNLLLVIDLQNAFINEFTNKSIVDIMSLIDSNKYDKVLFTQFVNDKNNPTYKKLGYKECIDEESKKICIDINKYDVIEKNTYTAYNDEFKKYIEKNNIENIYICGIDVECCVLITTLNLFENNYNIYLLKDYVYSMNGDESKENAIEILKRNIGIFSII